jgi:formylglycine-generating enzyme
MRIENNACAQRRIPVFFVCLICLLAALFFLSASTMQADDKGGGFSGGKAHDSFAWYANSIALVVGVDDYTQGWPRLQEAVNDAEKMAARLSADGFTVYKLLNQQATKEEILKYLHDVIPPKLGPGDRFVLYFSGHGQTEGGVSGQLGYLVPATGKKGQGKDLFHTYLSMKEIRNILIDKYRARHVLLVADACFSGLLTGRMAGSSPSAAAAMAKSGKMVITAGGKGEPAEDGLFTDMLLKGLGGEADTNRDGYVSFAELALFGQQRTTQQSEGRQHPVYGWWDGEGEILFRSGQTEPKVMARSPSIVPPLTPPVKSGEDMALIPAGISLMGCPSHVDAMCADDEKPITKIYVDAFWMNLHEVSVKDYAKCVISGKCKEPGKHSGGDLADYYNWGKADRQDHPVNGVSWEDARSYCEWKKKRLPTEAEFAKALRQNDTRRRYPWGKLNNPPTGFVNVADDSLLEKTWAQDRFSEYDDGYAGTAPVCSFAKNPYHLCDISGNVWEWCADAYNADWYAKMPKKNPVNGGESKARVLRGGGFMDGPDGMRVSNRGHHEPTHINVDVGFRCARSK